MWIYGMNVSEGILEDWFPNFDRFRFWWDIPVGVQIPLSAVLKELVFMRILALFYFYGKR